MTPCIPFPMIKTIMTKGPMDSKVYSLSILRMRLIPLGITFITKEGLMHQKFSFVCISSSLPMPCIILGDEEKHAQFCGF